MNKSFNFLKNLLDKLASKLTTRKLEESLLSSSSTIENQIRAELRNDLNTYYQNEDLIRTYSTVQLERTLMTSAPEYIRIEANEQLAARVALVGVTGQRYDVDIFWHTGEQFSTDAFYSKIAGALDIPKIKGAERSNFVRSAVVEANFYIQRWTPLKQA